MSGFRTVSVLCMGILIALASPASATPQLLFSDTFQGNLDQWVTNDHGIIVPDPLVTGGNALAFSALNAGGDLWSPVIPGTSAGVFTLGFYVLGDCGQTSGCGAFFGIQQVSGGEHWITADTAFPGLVSQFADTGAWEWVTVSFTATSAFQVKFEDYAGSPNAYGYTEAGGASVYFKDLQIYAGDVSPSGPVLDSGSDVPEPASIAILGSALAGLGMMLRFPRFRSRSLLRATAANAEQS
jgi:hypothetical protein